MFSRMMKDKLTILKEDGSLLENILGSVQGEKIFIMNEKIPILSGDIIIRTLPSGVEEKYSVIEPGFYSGVGGIQGHYQIQCERYNATKTNKENNSPITVNYHISGDNSKVNIHSIDNSITNQTTQHTVFENLKQTIEENLKDTPSYEVLLKIVLEMEQEKGKDTFIEKYQTFINLASSHMSLFAPLLPALSKLLS